MRSSAGRAPGPTIVLDARMRRGGGDRYLTELCARLPAAGRASFRTVTRPAPFTPWGQWAVARECARAMADLLYGLHVEVRPSPRRRWCPSRRHPARVPGVDARRARRLVYRRTLDTALAGARRVIVPSEATAQALARHGSDVDRFASCLWVPGGSTTLSAQAWARGMR